MWNVRVGPKPEKLQTSICLPLCPQERTSPLATSARSRLARSRACKSETINTIFALGRISWQHRQWPANFPDKRRSIHPLRLRAQEDLRGKSVGSPKSCLVAGEDDEKASQLISEIQKFRLPADPNHFYIPQRPVPQRGDRASSRARSGMRWTRRRQASNSEPDE